MKLKISGRGTGNPALLKICVSPYLDTGNYEAKCSGSIFHNFLTSSEDFGIGQHFKQQKTFKSRCPEENISTGAEAMCTTVVPIMPLICTMGVPIANAKKFAIGVTYEIF